MQEISAKELKDIKLNMIKEVDSICRKHGITYYAISGTLLGAIRHNGFIPNDYSKFREVIKIESDNLRFDCLENSTYYPYAYGKVCRIDTLIKESNFKGYKKSGVFIDVSRIDNRGNKEEAMKLYTKLYNPQVYWLSTFSLNSEFTNNTIKNWYRKIREIWRKRKTTRKRVECIDSLSKKLLLTQKEYCSWIHEKPLP